MDKKKEWFECWFDSPYYHILYKKRDENEARIFLDNLVGFLNPLPGARILDVACGKGRHSIYLNQKGFDVTGFDLSPENIEYDQQFENEKLSFFLHDMRETYRTNYYDFVFNLFTSFGYFEKERDNAKTILASAQSLKPEGVLVIDYMNSSKVITSLIPDETKNIDGINFHIHKEIVGGNILKKINFTDRGKDFEYSEQLSLLTRNDFEKYFSSCHLSITDIFGDYNLSAYDEKKSDRLILIAKKLS